MANSRQAVRDVVKGAGIVYVGLFAELVIAFLAQVLAARYLEVSGFGGLVTGTALLNIGAILGGLGLASGLTRYFPRIPASEKRALARAVLGITAVTSLLLALVIVPNARFIAADVFGDESVEVSIRIFGAAIPFATVLTVAVGGIRGQKRPLDRVYVNNLFHPIARFVLVVVVLYYGLERAGVAAAYAVPYAASAMLAVVFLHRSLPRADERVDWSRLVEVTRYSVPFTVSGVSGFVYRSIDIFLILRFLGSFAVGAYGVAYAAVSFMGMFSTAFNFLSSPIASELEADGSTDGLLRVFESVARWLVIGSVCMLVPLGVFATDFISLIYGSRYASGGLALLVLAVGFAVKNVMSIHGPILEALGKSKLISLNSVAAAVTNVVLNLVLIPVLGIVGAALATVLAFLVRDVLGAVQVRYYLGRSPLAVGTLVPVGIAVPLLAPVVWFAALVPRSFGWLLFVSAAFSATYVLAILSIVGLSPTEVMLLRSIEEKYGLDLRLFDVLVRRFS